MGLLGNIIWFICGGFWQGIAWTLAGILWCVTIVGIPIGVQCFKFASLAFFPFGKEIVYGGGAVSLIANIIWIIVSGIPLAISALTNGLLLCLTIIGIPFGNALKWRVWHSPPSERLLYKKISCVSAKSIQNRRTAYFILFYIQQTSMSSFGQSVRSRFPPFVTRTISSIRQPYLPSM